MYRQRRDNNEPFLSLTMTDMELAILHEIPWRNTQFMIDNPTLHYNPDECAVTIVARKQITFTKFLGSGAFGMVKINFFKQCFKLISGSVKQICIF